MPYYAGDWYGTGDMGDYYGGDPGLGGFLRRGLGFARRLLAPTLARTVPGAGVIMNVAKAGGALSRAASMGKMIVKAHPAGTAVMGAVAAAGGLAAVSHRGAPTGAGMARIREMAPGGPGVGMRGYHISRRTGAMVRNRRMRVTNPKALRRAIRRATGFARIARKVLHFTSPRAPRGRAHFRAGRRSTRAVRV